MACGLIWKETAGTGEVPWDGVLFEQIKGDYCRNQKLVGNQRRKPMRKLKSVVTCSLEDIEVAQRSLREVSRGRPGLVIQCSH